MSISKLGIIIIKMILQPFWFELDELLHKLINILMHRQLLLDKLEYYMCNCIHKNQGSLRTLVMKSRSDGIFVQKTEYFSQ